MLSIIYTIVAVAATAFSVLMNQVPKFLPGLAKIFGTTATAKPFIIIMTVIQFIILVMNVFIMYSSDGLIAKKGKFWKVSCGTYVFCVAGMVYCLLRFIIMLTKCGV